MRSRTNSSSSSTSAITFTRDSQNSPPSSPPDSCFGHLKKEIAESKIDAIDSFSVPPTGDVSLSEARALWPDKMIFMNTASHMAWSEPDDVRAMYAGLADEWGDKRGILMELVEDLPDETVGAHLSAAMDAFGY